MSSLQISRSFLLKEKILKGGKNARTKFQRNN